MKRGHKETHLELVTRGTQGVHRSCYEDSSSETDGNDGFQRGSCTYPLDEQLVTPYSLALTLLGLTHLNLSREITLTPTYHRKLGKDG